MVRGLASFSSSSANSMSECKAAVSSKALSVVRHEPLNSLGLPYTEQATFISVDLPNELSP